MQKKLIQAGITYHINKSNGIVLSMDNENVRNATDFIQTCYKSTTTTINPIVDWSDDDVWEFLRYYGCMSNPLYQCGRTRIGCVGCPMGRNVGMTRDFEYWPKFKDNYIRSFDKMLIEIRNHGKEWRASDQTGEAVFNWWIRN